MKKFSKAKVVGLVLAVLLMCVLGIIGINYYVVRSTDSAIARKEQERGFYKHEAECIVVLGAGVLQDCPSPILQDRLDKAIWLYKEGMAPKIIMTGDHGKKDYDEVNVMKNYAVRKGIAPEDIFMDHAGFSTYESLYRVKEVFGAKRILIVTQRYHMYRSLYIATKLGLEAAGMPAKDINPGNKYRKLREMMAISKDFVWCIVKPKPKFLGDKIPISGNGNLTNDR